MIYWTLIFVGGILGSGHCVGMCGGFALALGATRSRWAGSLARQLVYGLGRVFTYTVGGAVAGYWGWRLAASIPHLFNLQAVLSILAGLLLLIQGLIAAGVLRQPQLGSARYGCLLPGLFAALLRETRLHSVFLAGLVNGFLPCGLVYAYLALAAGSGDLLHGSAVMALFGLGTVPVLALVGSGGTLLGMKWRKRLLVLGAWCVVLTGVLSLARGVGVIHIPGIVEPATCALCQ
jgi:sulfite exporter TauE/SafE